MSCQTPITIRDANKVATAVPCMKCHPCRLARVRQWVFRIQEERKHHLYAHFVTLTYETTPKSPSGLSTLDTRDLQLFFKRLRKTSSLQIKYFAVGEYGTLRRRPHYHAIILGSISESDIIKSWQNHINGDVKNGTCLVLPLTDGGATAYVVKYVDKGRLIPMFATDDRQPERALMSKGLGSRYLTPQMVSWHRRSPDGWSIMSEGQTSPMPRYFKNKIFDKVFDKDTGKLLGDFKYLLQQQLADFKKKMDERYERNVLAFGSEVAYMRHVYESTESGNRTRRLYNQTKSRMDL